MAQVTVIIPVYNRAAVVKACIESVRSQTFKDWELVAVDDGSTDASVQVLTELAKNDPRIKVIQQPNGGAQKARNRGLQESRTEWVAFLDSDDTWTPRSLELRMDLAAREGVSAVHGQGDVILPDGSRKSYEAPPISGDIYKAILRSEGPVFIALLLRKKLLESIGFLDESIVAFQEWDTCLRLARKGARFGFVPESTFVYDCSGADTISKQYRRGGVGYEQILKKFSWDMFRLTGPYTLIRHFDAAADWYHKGGDAVSEARCRRKARFYRLFHWRSIREKLFR